MQRLCLEVSETSNDIGGVYETSYIGLYIALATLESLMLLITFSGIYFVRWEYTMNASTCTRPPLPTFVGCILSGTYYVVNLLVSTDFHYYVPMCWL